MRGLPPRVVVALIVTVVALGAMLVIGLVNREPGEPAVSDETPTTSTSTVRSTTTAAIPTTTLEIPLDWYPKQSSRYSDRQPPVSVTTLPTTTTRPERSGGRDDAG